MLCSFFGGFTKVTRSPGGNENIVSFLSSKAEILIIVDSVKWYK